MAYVSLFLLAATLCFLSVGVAAIAQILLFFFASALPVFGIIGQIKKGEATLRDAQFLQCFAACSAFACFLWPLKFPPILSSFELWWAVSLGYAGLALLLQWVFCEDHSLNAFGPVKQCSVVLLFAVAYEWQAVKLTENAILQSEIGAMALLAASSLYLVHRKIRHEARN